LAVDGWRFVEDVRPFLERQDVAGLAHYLTGRWPTERLAEFLTHSNPDVVKVAACCLGLVGDMQVNEPLAALLSHQDRMVAVMAEHALWSIWLRAADAAASRRLSRAIRWLNANNYDQAVAELSRLIDHQPDFAEAYNQRAIAYYLAGDYDRSLADCQRTLQLNPVHFGAQAGAGHCLAALRRWQEALAAYERALRIHPRLDGIRHAAVRIRERLQHARPRADHLRTADEPTA
jgi:tetratricopeptide (TPR) repeat protein